MRPPDAKLNVEPQAAPADALAHSPVLLQASGLRKAFGGKTVLDGVSLDLRQGEVVLLRGANGSGKTTLVNLMTGNLEPDAGAIRLFTNEEAQLLPDAN